MNNEENINSCVAYWTTLGSLITANEEEDAKKFVEDIAEKEDLNHYINKNGDNGYCIELEYWSGLGEDVIITLVVAELTVEKIIAEMDNYVDSFDAEEHAGELFNMKGKCGTPTSLRALLTDADEQKSKLEHIYNTMLENKNAQ